MGVDQDVPFYANPDSTHCFQAALKMVLKHYFPSEEHSWGFLDSVTAKVDGLWTWPLAGSVWLASRGLEVRDIELFDYDAFVRDGEGYVTSFYGEEVGRDAIAHSRIGQEQEHALTFLRTVRFEKRQPSHGDLRRLLDEGHLLVCNVNGRVLSDRPGWAGHFVVVKGYDESGFVLHDPGPPPLEGRHVAHETFDRAWSYPHERVRNVISLRLR